MNPASKEFDTLYQIALDETIRTGKTSLTLVEKTLNVSNDTASLLLEKMINGERIEPFKDDYKSYIPKLDALYGEVEVWAKQKEQLSLGDIQRNFKLSWSRAKRLLLALENRRIVSEGKLDEKRVVLNKV